jgi:PglZ domain
MKRNHMDMLEWFLHKLDAIKDESAILVRDPLQLLPERDNSIHNFASEHGYTVIVAATNLAFRELYEQATADPDTQKLLVIDRTPQSRRMARSKGKAPPLFYPDLLARVPPGARIELDLRQYLKEITGDPDWPREVNEPHYARIVMKHLPGVIQAHKNLRVIQRERFSTHDFHTIVASAALDVADTAFQKPDDIYYWRIGLHGYQTLEELEKLAPAVTDPIKRQLAKAPPPFCWFGKYETELIIRAFYLSVILAQHASNWKLLLINVDQALKGLTTIETGTLEQAARKLVELDPEQAQEDLDEIEAHLSREGLQTLLIDELAIEDAKNAATVIEKEGYSTLFRTLALLLALEDLIFPRSDVQAHKRIINHLFSAHPAGFVESRSSLVWSNLKEAYRLVYAIQKAQAELSRSLRNLGVKASNELNFLTFRDLWNAHGINRLEYHLSALKRLVYYQNLLPRESDTLPVEFVDALKSIQERVDELEKEVFQQINELNALFQEMVAKQYPGWLTKDSDLLLTSQFIRHCLKPNWDPKTEKAVVLVFDGMRYDIWDELLRPMLLEKMEIIQEFPASAILPSETHVSRWAIAAGTEPDQFGLTPRRAESDCLKEALARELGYHIGVDTIAPDGSGTGETVRYRAGNLDYYIFEFCDKELHKIEMKEYPDGRKEPSRPLALIYQQYLKNLIDTEVMAIIRRLTPRTKVFITADHGFGLVGQEWLGIDSSALNDLADCVYLNCLLSVPVSSANLHPKVRKNIISFTPAQLHYPMRETWTAKTGAIVNKQYQAILFPKVGYSFSRGGSRYKPAAYGHGGISIQELLIPMVVLQVKAREEELLTLHPINGPKEAVEGEEIEFRMRLTRTAGRSKANELRVDVEASYGDDIEQGQGQLPPQVLYVAKQNEVVYRFRPDHQEATTEEHRQGLMKRELTIIIRYREGNRTIRKLQKYPFAVRLNSERVIRRVPASLGNILGLTPKSMR